jgi:molybdate transport system permease protein
MASRKNPDMNSFWPPLFLSLQLATVTALLLLALGIFISYFIYFYTARTTALFKSIISLPLVLPPTVLGYYLLVAFRPDNILGKMMGGQSLAFSFTGLVIGSMIYSLPFMMNPVFSALENLPDTLKDAAFTLGKSKRTTFYKVIIPNIKPSIWIGAVMSFAHTIGEFGVVLMIGGNIPGKTRVASIAIYNEVEKMNYSAANFYAAILLVFSLIVLFGLYSYQQQKNIRLL